MRSATTVNKYSKKKKTEKKNIINKTRHKNESMYTHVKKFLLNKKKNKKES